MDCKPKLVTHLDMPEVVFVGVLTKTTDKIVSTTVSEVADRRDTTEHNCAIEIDDSEGRYDAAQVEPYVRASSYPELTMSKQERIMRVLDPLGMKSKDGDFFLVGADLPDGSGRVPAIKIYFRDGKFDRSTFATNTGPVAPHHAAPLPVDALAAWRWLRSGDTGLSSLTIWAVMMDEPVGHSDVPHDVGDLGRCIRLLELFPAWSTQLDKLTRFAEWQPFVREWPQLTLRYAQATDGWKSEALGNMIVKLLAEGT